ncbi:hypothetical protein HNP84_009679 [Thermocatellispora tengchongensis]|uniref:Uncharacterized protein n=1 Tax=Thermocatellispora tengchongensis TaxID=1073253 RepID=A0A840PVK2_9ACTN|nr:hypothetical protein [Thermocatellispora tengchongensis]MBB5139915.1 hypothetical protein [Thermocatellispora tengchongensis]
MSTSRRMALLSPATHADFVAEMVDLSVAGLPPGYVDGEFVFTRRGVRGADGTWTARPEGRSVRYAAIVALGVNTLPEERQREALSGDTALDLTGHLIKGLPARDGLGDVALICWAAAETGHSDLGAAVDRLAALESAIGPQDQVFTVEAAWALAAAVAVRAAGGPMADAVLERSRERLLRGLRQDRLYRHTLGPASGPLVPWYRAHVGCFADQVYPLQALARLHRLAGDPDALAAAERVAAGICAAQGPEGQWWWHYDARSGAVVEGFPVYSVHQLAMGPMALLDLADAGGGLRLQEIALGLGWMLDRPETQERMVLPELALTWRKAAREDPRKVVRGARAAATRVRPGARLGVLDRVYPPVAVDRECRPYELGWLLYAWLFGGADR